jgi:hypothetical protein
MRPVEADNGQLELDSLHNPRDWEPGFWVPKDRGEETAAGRDAGGATPVGHGDGAGLGGAEQGPKGFGGAGRGAPRQGTAEAGGRLAYGEGEARATRRVD